MKVTRKNEAVLTTKDLLLHAADFLESHPDGCPAAALAVVSDVSHPDTDALQHFVNHHQIPQPVTGRRVRNRNFWAIAQWYDSRVRDYGGNLAGARALREAAETVNH